MVYKNWLSHTIFSLKSSNFISKYNAWKSILLQWYVRYVPTLKVPKDLCHKAHITHDAVTVHALVLGTSITSNTVLRNDFLGGTPPIIPASAWDVPLTAYWIAHVSSSSWWNHSLWIPWWPPTNGTSYHRQERISKLLLLIHSKCFCLMTTVYLPFCSICHNSESEYEQCTMVSSECFSVLCQSKLMSCLCV